MARIVSEEKVSTARPCHACFSSSFLYAASMPIARSTAPITAALMRVTPRSAGANRKKAKISQAGKQKAGAPCDSIKITEVISLKISGSGAGPLGELHSRNDYSRFCGICKSTIKNRLRFALTISAEIIFLYLRLSRPAGRSKRIFHKRGRNSKRLLFIKCRFPRRPIPTEPDKSELFPSTPSAVKVSSNRTVWVPSL